jgi:predicted  nucleic acid-binding Zn-ribbon protein
MTLDVERCARCGHLRADHEPEPITRCAACACTAFVRPSNNIAELQRVLDAGVKAGTFRKLTTPPGHPDTYQSVALPPHEPIDLFARMEETEANPAAADAYALAHELAELRKLPRVITSEASTNLTLVASTLARGGRAELAQAMLHAARLLYVIANEHQGEKINGTPAGG